MLCNRFGERVVQIEGHKCFYGPGSDALNIVDHHTNERRQPVVKSDAKTVNQQASVEAALSLAFATMEGANLIHDMGYLEAGRSGSHAMLVLCNEVIEWLAHAFSGVEINDETLALDLIDQKGPNGNFLDDAHTVKHFRERWLPGILDQSPFDIWEAEGSKTLGTRLGKRVDKILSKHTPVALPENVKARVHAILERVVQKTA